MLLELKLDYNIELYIFVIWEIIFENLPYDLFIVFLGKKCLTFYKGENRVWLDLKIHAVIYVKPVVILNYKFRWSVYSNFFCYFLKYFHITLARQHTHITYLEFSHNLSRIMLEGLSYALHSWERGLATFENACGY